MVKSSKFPSETHNISLTIRANTKKYLLLHCRHWVWATFFFAFFLRFWIHGNECDVIRHPGWLHNLLLTMRPQLISKHFPCTMTLQFLSTIFIFSTKTLGWPVANNGASHVKLVWIMGAEGLQFLNCATQSLHFSIHRGSREVWSPHTFMVDPPYHGIF